MQGLNAPRHLAIEVPVDANDGKGPLAGVREVRSANAGLAPKRTISLKGTHSHVLPRRLRQTRAVASRFRIPDGSSRFHRDCAFHATVVQNSASIPRSARLARALRTFWLPVGCEISMRGSLIFLALRFGLRFAYPSIQPTIVNRRVIVQSVARVPAPCSPRALLQARCVRPLSRRLRTQNMHSVLQPVELSAKMLRNHRDNAVRAVCRRILRTLPGNSADRRENRRPIARTAGRSLRAASTPMRFTGIPLDFAGRLRMRGRCPESPESQLPQQCIPSPDSSR